MVLMTRPKQWKSGTWINSRSAGLMPMTSPTMAALLMTFRWVSMTPLGKPVVPEVYCMFMTSSKLSSASRLSRSSRLTPPASSSIWAYLNMPGVSARLPM